MVARRPKNLRSRAGNLVPNPQVFQTLANAPRPQAGVPVELLARQTSRESFGTAVGVFQFRKQALGPGGEHGDGFHSTNPMQSPLTSDAAIAFRLPTLFVRGHKTLRRCGVI